MSTMYSAPKVYADVVVPPPKLDMYHMKPIHDDVMIDDGPLDEQIARDIEVRQEKCLKELGLLQGRLDKLQADCSKQSTKCGSSNKKLNLVLGCRVGCPTVYLAVVLAQKEGCSMKVYSHSSNTKEVDSNLTNKLLQINQKQGGYCGITLIYKNVTAPYFMLSPGRQVAVSGLSNILRFVSRDLGYTSLYDETDLLSVAVTDEILALIDLLEAKLATPTASNKSEISGILEKLSAQITPSGPYLGGRNSISIADIALCCSLGATPSSYLTNTLRSYLDKCCNSNSELSVIQTLS